MLDTLTRLELHCIEADCSDRRTAQMPLLYRAILAAIEVPLLAFHASVIVLICRARKKDSILQNMFFSIYVVVSFCDCMETISVRNPTLFAQFFFKFCVFCIPTHWLKDTQALALRNSHPLSKASDFLHDTGVSCTRGKGGGGTEKYVYRGTSWPALRVYFSSNLLAFESHFSTCCYETH